MNTSIKTTTPHKTLYNKFGSWTDRKTKGECLYFILSSVARSQQLTEKLWNSENCWEIYDRILAMPNPSFVVRWDGFHQEYFMYFRVNQIDFAAEMNIIKEYLDVE